MLDLLSPKLSYIIRDATHFRVKMITFGTSNLVASRMINLISGPKHVNMIFIWAQALGGRTDARTHTDEYQVLRPLHNRLVGQ